MFDNDRSINIIYVNFYEASLGMFSMPNASQDTWMCWPIISCLLESFLNGAIDNFLELKELVSLAYGVIKLQIVINTIWSI